MEVPQKRLGWMQICAAAQKDQGCGKSRDGLEKGGPEAVGGELRGRADRRSPGRRAQRNVRWRGLGDPLDPLPGSSGEHPERWVWGSLGLLSPQDSTEASSKGFLELVRPGVCEQR